MNNIAKKVFEIEAREIKNLSKNLSNDFSKIIYAIYEAQGKLIISGMGKSGLIGKKIAATLASTGTPSFFLHPGEAYHGDLGMIEKDDTVLLISNSGETDEILKLISFLKRQKNLIIGMSGNPNSTLAKNSNFHLNIHVQKEACPLQLAPTSSTTATLVMGDALAICLMELRGFKENDFAQFHPGGSLGRRLLTKVKDVMHTKDLPICEINEDIKSVIHAISSSRFGLCVAINNGKIKGIITDGDIRRAMTERQEEFFSFIAKDIMSASPIEISEDEKLTKAQRIMSDSKINSLLVTKDNGLVGIIQIYDLDI